MNWNKEDDVLLNRVRTKTKKLCLEAAEQCEFALQQKNQTEETCLKAVRQNGCALKYVRNLSMIKELEPKIINTNARTIYVIKLDGEYKFSIGYQSNISKDEFIDKIYNTDGGLKKNPHRQEYLDILKNY